MEKGRKVTKELHGWWKAAAKPPPTPEGKPKLHLSLPCFSFPLLGGIIEPSFSSVVGKGHPHPYSQAINRSPQPGMEGVGYCLKGVMVDGEGVYGVKLPPAKMAYLFMLVPPSSWAFTPCSHHPGPALPQHCPTSLAEGLGTGAEHWQWVPRVPAWAGLFSPFSWDSHGTDAPPQPLRGLERWLPPTSAGHGELPSRGKILPHQVLGPRWCQQLLSPVH